MRIGGATGCGASLGSPWCVLLRCLTSSRTKKKESERPQQLVLTPSLVMMRGVASLLSVEYCHRLRASMAVVLHKLLIVKCFSWIIHLCSILVPAGLSGMRQQSGEGVWDVCFKKLGVLTKKVRGNFQKLGLLFPKTRTFLSRFSQTACVWGRVTNVDRVGVCPILRAGAPCSPSVCFMSSIVVPLYGWLQKTRMALGCTVTVEPRAYLSDKACIPMPSVVLLCV